MIQNLQACLLALFSVTTPDLLHVFIIISLNFSKRPGAGMSLALIIVTTLYFLCSITLTLMLPYTLISPDAAFSQVLLDPCFPPPACCPPDDQLVDSSCA